MVKTATRSDSAVDAAAWADTAAGDAAPPPPQTSLSAPTVPLILSLDPAKPQPSELLFAVISALAAWLGPSKLQTLRLTSTPRGVAASSVRASPRPLVADLMTAITLDRSSRAASSILSSDSICLRWSSRISTGGELIAENSLLVTPPSTRDLACFMPRSSLERSCSCIAN